MRCRKVVPLRGRPVMNTGGAMRCAQDRRVAPFGIAHLQQVGQEAHHVPARREAAHHTEIGLGQARFQQLAQCRFQVGVAEIVQAGPLPGELDQIMGGQRPVQPANLIGQRIGQLQHDGLDRQATPSLQHSRCSSCAGTMTPCMVAGITPPRGGGSVAWTPPTGLAADRCIQIVSLTRYPAAVHGGTQSQRRGFRPWPPAWRASRRRRAAATAAR